MGGALAKKEPSLFPETEAILALLEKGQKHEIVVLVVPNHDKHNKRLGDALVAEWKMNAMHLMADLYKGGTCYAADNGIYKTDEGHYLLDEPFIVESFATEAAIQDPERLQLLVEFCKRMGKTLDRSTSHSTSTWTARCTTPS
jgi:hypothetical protein